MTLLSALGEFPEMVLGLAFSLGCALLLAFLCLRLLLSLMTRQQYNVAHNVINDPSHTGSILWLGAAVAGASGSSDAATADALDSGATGSPYLLPAAAPHNRFSRIAKPDANTGGGVVQLPQTVAGRIAQGGRGDGWGGDAGVGTTATPPESGLPSTPSRVRVTLSEDARGPLLVAEVFSGDNRQVAMLPWNPPSSVQAKPRINITKKLFWTEAEPILDMLLVDSDSQMLILDADKIASYRWMGDKWTLFTATLRWRFPARFLATLGGGWRPRLEDLKPSCRSGPALASGTPKLKLRCDGGIANWPGTFGTHWAGGSERFGRGRSHPKF